MVSFTKKEQIVILLLIIGIIIIVGYNLINKEDTTISDKLNEEESESTQQNVDQKEKPLDSSNDTESEGPKMIMVHISGQVHRPGLVILEKDQRVIDAVDKAGGLIEGKADYDKINLAKKLSDEEKVYIPAIGEDTGALHIEDNMEGYILSDSDANDSKININTATQKTLEELPGIGEVLAKRIIDYREIHRFQSISEIILVSGIGDKKFEEIKDWIEVK